MQKLIKVAVIGLGNIAQGYNNPDDIYILTHLKAYIFNGNFQISYIFDTDKNKSKKVLDLWNLKDTAILNNLDDLKKKEIDVISICTPDHTHYEILKKVVDYFPRLVFCEKPLSLNLGEAKEIVKLYEYKNIKLVINYSRRWQNKIIEIKNNINQNIFGNILSVRMKYYNGFLHNGSHLIDLVNMFLKPKVKNGIILTEKKYSDLDTIISACCNLDSSFGNFNLVIEGYNGLKMNPLELEFFFERYKVLIKEENGSKILIYNLIENNIYKGYYEFVEKQNVYINESEAMINAVTSIHNYFISNNNDTLISTGLSALETLSLCSEIFSFKRITNV